MSLDGSVCASIIYELNNTLQDGKIDKIYQPSTDEIIINMRVTNNKYKLLMSCSGTYPRIHITNKNIDNPSYPPAFCMLLRKHLEGSILKKFSQFKMDRIIRLDFSAKDELGLIEDKSIFIEIMGKYSNIILVDKNNKIVDAIKRINFNKSSVREILPGVLYNPNEISKSFDPRLEDNFFNKISSADKNKNIKNFLMNTYTGIGPQMVFEIAYRSNLDIERNLGGLSLEELKNLEGKFYDIFKNIKKNNFTPIKIYRDDKLHDFYCIDLETYSTKDKKFNSSISAILDEFYSEKQVKNGINSITTNYKKLINSQIKKTKRKLSLQSEELNEAINREKYKIYADLISSNFYKINTGDKSLTCENYYDNMTPITIPLDIKLNPRQNANNYYQKYSKLKKASEILKKQIEEDEALISYLESILINISFIDSMDEVDDLKEEMQNQGLIKTYKKASSKKKKSIQNNFLSFEFSGYNIYVGKNNKQNDYLTLKFAKRDDYWFHIQEGAGSHVIVKNKGEDIPKDVINAAAALAAKYSSFKDSNNIMVAYTKKANIKRHPSRKLGLVIYNDFSTINIKKDNNFLDKLVHEKNKDKD